MFYLFTIIISLILWICFFYIKSTREYDGKPLKAPLWLYLIELVFLFVPFFSFLCPFIVILCMIFDKDLKLKNGKQGIGEKIKNLLNKEF